MDEDNIAPCTVPAPSVMSLRLVLPDGTAQELSDVQPEETVFMLKERIQRQHSIRAENLELSFFGHVLENNCTLPDCGVASGGTVQVRLRAPGVLAPLVGAPGASGAALGPKAPPAPAPAPVPAQVPAPTAIRDPTEVTQASDVGILVSRQELVSAVFAALGPGTNGRLSKEAMRNFASHTGFDGSEADWDEEYALLCKEGVDGRPGVSVEVFTGLVQDRTEAGCYLSDDELRSLLQQLRQEGAAPVAAVTASAPPVPTVRPVVPAPPASAPLPGAVTNGNYSREELQAEVFGYCDVDRDGRLSRAEMCLFARHTGFDGDDAAWTEEFQQLCNEVSVDPQTGVGMAPFMQLVNDTSEKGCYCSNEELLDMLKLMKAARPGGNADASPAGNQTQADPRRLELVRGIFSILDRDGDNRLNETEMREFAGCTGFDGLASDWHEEYQHLCSDLGVADAIGLDLPKLQQLVDDESSNSGCYCPTDELEAMLDQLKAKSTLAPVPPSSQVMPKSAPVPTPTAFAPDHEELVKRLFRACDVDGDGFLSKGEMMRFASKTGFDGTPDQWDEEFNVLCMENDADPSKGIDAKLFQRLVEDVGEGGCYCSDDEIRTVLQQLDAEKTTAPNPPSWPSSVAAAAEASSAPRRELVDAIFRLCDADGDEKLDEREMLIFATKTGFDGLPEEWTEEYSLLCHEKGVDVGVNLQLFRQLVEDRSDRGCYCSDEELSNIWEALKREPPVAAAKAPLAAPAPGPGVGANDQVESKPASIPQLAAEVPATSDGNGCDGATLQHAVGNGALEPEPRQKLITDLFRGLDSAGSGHLRQKEMLNFARLTGFTGSEQEWEEEYQLLCSENSLEDSKSFDLPTFSNFVNDQGETGQYCSDEELKAMLARLEAESAQALREALAAPPPMPAPAPVPAPAVAAAVVAPGRGPEDASREVLVSTVFNACDRDRDGVLSEGEMHPFAELNGFEHGRDDWRREFMALCNDKGRTAEQGLDFQSFRDLVEDKSEAGCYCTDGELQDILKALAEQKYTWHQAEAPRPPAPQAPQEEVIAPSELPPALPTAPDMSAMTRRDLVLEVFHACDMDKDGLLDNKEMGRFAQETGFTGSEQEWLEEFELLCKDHRADHRRGVDVIAFQSLVEDKSDSGCFCSDDELRGMLRRLQPQQAAPGTGNSHTEVSQRPRSRQELMQAVFMACDVDGDNRLNQQEMHDFARHTGFEGTDVDWAEEFNSLCSEHGGSKERGVDLGMFTQLVNDDSENGIYCMDEDLKYMLNGPLKDNLHSNGRRR